MLSDERLPGALECFARQRAAFLAAVANTIDQVRSYLGVHAVGNGTRARLVQAELGAFANERIDFDRFASLFADRQVVDPISFETMEHALTTLSNLAARGDYLFAVEIGSDQTLGHGVGRALEEIGRAFGAARVFELTRSGQYRDSAHARTLGSFPFAKWNRTERRLAPPLFVSIGGADLRVGELVEFLDGAQKLVLLVQGGCPPAPLVRLITPRTFVMQCRDGADLQAFAAWEGPGIAALVPDGAAVFTHDPAAGSRSCDRLTIAQLPETPPRQPIGGLSVAQQAEELEQLRALAETPVGVASPVAAVVSEPGSVPSAAPADPVDKLAAWLMSHADLADVE